MKKQQLTKTKQEHNTVLCCRICKKPLEVMRRSFRMDLCPDCNEKEYKKQKKLFVK